MVYIFFAKDLFVTYPEWTSVIIGITILSGQFAFRPFQNYVEQESRFEKHARQKIQGFITRYYLPLYITSFLCCAIALVFLIDNHIFVMIALLSTLIAIACFMQRR